MSNQNVGHGHVHPRPDGVRARCGGPGLCSECSRELIRKHEVEINNLIVELVSTRRDAAKAQRDAARYRLLREEGIVTGDAPVRYVYKDEADEYVDDLIRDALKFKGGKA